MGRLGLNVARQPTDPALADAWETQRDQYNQQTAAGLTAILPPGAANRAGFNSGLREFLEMDFPPAQAREFPGQLAIALKVREDERTIAIRGRKDLPQLAMRLSRKGSEQTLSRPATRSAHPPPFRIPLNTIGPAARTL